MFEFALTFLIILHATLLRFNSLLFGIISGDFQLTKCLVDVICPLDHLPVIRVVFFFISKQILQASVFSKQVVDLQIRFVSYIKI